MQRSITAMTEFEPVIDSISVRIFGNVMDHPAVTRITPA